MTVEETPAPPVDGIDHREWGKLVERGRTTGEVHADQVSHVLRHVELSETVLTDVHTVMAGIGIAIDNQLDDDDVVIAEITSRLSVLDEAPSSAADVADEALLSRRRQRRTKKRGPSGEGGGADAVRMYLREIGQVDLLSIEDERRLAQLIEEGKVAAAEIDRSHEDRASGSTVDERNLLRAVKRGERAKSELTQANLRLVVSIAKRYSGRGMQLLDLVQEGNLGLMRAVDKFDHTKGFKFSTYATWWIRQAITRSIADQARTIRIPVHMVEHMNRVTRTKRSMHQELEREPTIEELAQRVQLEPNKVRELLRYSQDPLSLDSPVGEEDESNLGDFIQDESADSPADAATRVMLSSAVGEMLGELSDREQEIVRLRFGLNGGQAKTLEEVGLEFGVTRERIRQIEAKTLAKLRHPQRSQRLREFLEAE